MSSPGNKMRLIGRMEFVDFPELNLSGLEAKVDTGAYTSAIHCSRIYVHSKDNKEKLCFKIPTNTLSEQSTTLYEMENFSRKVIKNSFGEVEERYIIKTKIRLGKKTILSTISLSDRESMRFPVLIGRRFLKGQFLVDVSREKTGGVLLKKVIKEYI